MQHLSRSETHLLQLVLHMHQRRLGMSRIPKVGYNRTKNDESSRMIESRSCSLREHLQEVLSVCSNSGSTHCWGMECAGKIQCRRWADAGVTDLEATTGCSRE